MAYRWFLGLNYLDHRTTDLKYNIITDVHVTPGNIHDSKPYLQRLDRQIERFGFDVEAVGLDAGYLTNPLCHGLTQRDVFGVIKNIRKRSRAMFGRMTKEQALMTAACQNMKKIALHLT